MVENCGLQLQKKVAEHVAQIFNVLVNGVTSFEEGRKSLKIDYNLLGKGDMKEIRFVLGKVIMDTMSSELYQIGSKVLEKENQSQEFKEDPDCSLSWVVKQLLVVKEGNKHSPLSFNLEVQEERRKKKKQKLVDMKIDPSDQEIAKEKQEEKSQICRGKAKRLVTAENEQEQERVKEHSKMLEKENLEISTKKQHKVASNCHPMQRKLAGKKSEQHKLEEAVNQKRSRPLLSSFFK